jgi:CHAT domain-containing protein
MIAGVLGRARGFPSGFPIVLLVLFGSPVEAGPPTLDECDARVQRAPAEPGSYYCYVTTAQATGEFRDATRRLEAFYQLHPDRHRALLARALIAQMADEDRAEALLTEAAEKTEQAGDRWGVVYARTSLGKLLSTRGRPEAARSQLDRALEVAEASNDPIMWAHAATVHAYGGERRADWGRELSLLRRAETLVFPDGPDYLKSWVLSGLGEVYWHLGDYQRALRIYERELKLLEKTGDSFTAAVSKTNIADTCQQLWTRGELPLDRCRSLAQEALEAAIRGGNRGMAAAARVALASLSEGREAIAQYRQALAASRSYQTRLDALLPMAKQTHVLGSEHREEAWRIWRQAEALARAAADPVQSARVLVLRAELISEEGRHEEAIAAYREALAAIERIRDLQAEDSLRARVFAAWLASYYRFSDYLLGTLGQSTRPERSLEVAFHTVERMRARLLLDRLDAARATLPPRGHPLHASRREVLTRIAAVQKELMDPQLAPERRSQALAELEKLEAAEAAARDRIAREDPRFGALRSPEIPRLDDLKAALRDDQALLSYQLWDRPPALEEARRTWQRGGSWVWVIRREGVRAFRVPASALLEEKVAMFVGLIENRDGSEAVPAASLFGDLLEEALQELPPSVTELIIVPDGPLHRLPFAALRPSPGDPPLATRFGITSVPSATMWMRWGARAGAARGGRALAFADPEIGRDEAAGFRDADPWIEGLRQGRLPSARREAQALVGGLGGGLVRSGPEASEGYLKQADLGPFGMLLFAAHAVVDNQNPERSAVLLARGGAQEDGLLQVREIVDLDLKDRVVVLSSCRSALGEQLQGEGILGLAHGFFQAGARGVIGSLWMLRDEEAAALVARLAGEVARGRSLSAALVAAQRSLIDEGAPAASWAGLVVLGDGALVLVPGGPHRASRTAWWLAGLAGVAALALGVLLRSRGRLRV